MDEPPDMSPEPPDSDRPDTTDPEPTCLCPLDGLFDQLSKQYAIPVVCVVGALEPVRYGDIESAFGADRISSSTLSSRLAELVAAGYLARTQYPEIPPRVEYELTPTGRELCDRLTPLLEWAREREQP